MKLLGHLCFALMICLSITGCASLTGDLSHSHSGYIFPSSAGDMNHPLLRIEATDYDPLTKSSSVTYANSHTTATVIFRDSDISLREFHRHGIEHINKSVSIAPDSITHEEMYAFTVSDKHLGPSYLGYESGETFFVKVHTRDEEDLKTLRNGRLIRTFQGRTHEDAIAWAEELTKQMKASNVVSVEGFTGLNKFERFEGYTSHRKRDPLDVEFRNVYGVATFSIDGQLIQVRSYSPLFHLNDRYNEEILYSGLSRATAIIKYITSRQIAD